MSLARHEGRPALLLNDPGPAVTSLEALLGNPPELGQFLRLAINLAGGIRRVGGPVSRFAYQSSRRALLFDEPVDIFRRDQVDACIVQWLSWFVVADRHQNLDRFCSHLGRPLSH